jgi:hypothetical protein
LVEVEVEVWRKMENERKKREWNGWHKPRHMIDNKQQSREITVIGLLTSGKRTLLQPRLDLHWAKKESSASLWVVKNRLKRLISLNTVKGIVSFHLRITLQWRSNALIGLVSFSRPLSATKHKHSESTNISENTRDSITTCKILTRKYNYLFYCGARCANERIGVDARGTQGKICSRGRHSLHCNVGFKLTPLLSVGLKLRTVYDEHIITESNSFLIQWHIYHPQSQVNKTPYSIPAANYFPLRF